MTAASHAPDGAWNTVLCRLEAIHEQSEKVRVIAAGMLRHAEHGVPCDIERSETNDREVETLHSLVRSALHAVRKQAGADHAPHWRRWTDLHEGPAPVHHLVIGGKREDDPPLRLTFDRLTEKT